MAKLAIDGGVPLRSKPYPSWPQWGVQEEEALKQTKAEIQDLEGLIQVELGKVKEKIADLWRRHIVRPEGGKRNPTSTDTIGIAPFSPGRMTEFLSFRAIYQKSLLRMLIVRQFPL